MDRLRVSYSVCKYLRNCTVFVLALALLSSFAVLAESGNTVNGSSTAGGKILQPPQPQANGQGRPRAQIFAGEGVRLRAHQLQSSNKALARAMKDFEKRGRAPMWEKSLTILETDSKSAAAIGGRGITRVSYPQTWTDGAYELTLITYSNSTSQWDGIIYLHNPYEDDTYAALITTPATAEWDTVYEYWYPPDGGDPMCGGGYCELQGRLTPKLSQTPNKGFINASHPLARRGFWGRIKSWVKCVWAEAVLSAAFCEDLWCAVSNVWVAATRRC